MRAIVLAAMLAGCAMQQERPAGGAPMGVCAADAAQGLIGQQRGDAVLTEARRLSGATIARFLAPDQITTKEFRQERINLSTDAAGVVVRVNCG